MNPIAPQQLQEHAADHRQRLIADMAAARTARPSHRSPRRLAVLAAFAAVGATAFFAGGMVAADGTSPGPTPAGLASSLRIQAPDCAVVTDLDEAPTVPTNRHVYRHRDRLDPIPV